MNEGFNYKGYAGKLLFLDLTRQKIAPKQYPKDLAENYLGGAGLASRILYDMIQPGIDPLSPVNVVVVATGPLTGTLFPQASRYIVAAKSPLTGIWGESHAAGHFGPEMKFAGYDGVIISGRSETPVYLFIENGKAELLDAHELWGCTTSETEYKIREIHGSNDRIKVASIGQAGENLVRFAAIINDKGRAAARSGMGAVWGSKNFKAIACVGYGELEVADPERYLDVIRTFHKRMLEDPFMPSRVEYGTTSLIELMQEIGRLPTYNLKQGVFDQFEAIGGEAIKQQYLVKPRADFACLQRCERYTCVPTGPYRYIGASPEFESQSALGSRCGNSKLESILYAHHICNLYGLDTISTGATISWAMECWEKGLLTEEDTEGINLSWGSHEVIIQLIHQIAARKGFGDLLAEGSYRAAQQLGKGQEYVMHVKKQEIAAQEPRAQKSMGLASATAARGADHLYAFPVLDEVGFGEAIKKRFGTEYLPEIGDRLDPKYKGLMVAKSENFMVIVESLGVCKYGTQIPPQFFYDDLALALEVTTGHKLSPEELERIGERIVNLNRAFNIREGIGRKDDSLPTRLTKIPSPTGPAKGQVVELEQMLTDYYKSRGWDQETGFPTRDKLEALGLSDIANDLNLA